MATRNSSAGNSARRNQRLVEVDLTEDAFNREAKVDPWNHPVDEYDNQGAHQCHEQRAGGRRQTQEPVVHVAEHGGGHENRGDIEGVHAPPRGPGHQP